MRRWPSVTRRHIDFLFNHDETVVARQVAVVERIIRREETVMSDLEARFKAAIIGSWYANGRAKTVSHGADLAWEATRHLFDGFELQLPTTDDDHVGDDVN